MSEPQGKFYAPLLSVLGGSVVAGLLGATIGFIFVVVWWETPASIESEFYRILWRLFAGGVTGGVSAFSIGMALAWQGGMLGTTTDRAEGSPAWGVVTGIVVGASLGPIACGFFGLLFGNLAGGAVLGLVLGPLSGVVAWEAGYWSADYFRSTRSSSIH